MPNTASPEILARVKENFEWWNGGEPQLMLNEYAEDAELDLSAVFTDTPLEVLDAGPRRFVVDVRLWGKGKLSGAEVEQRFAFLYTVREADNKIARAQLFPDVQAAMDEAKAGL